MSAMTTLLMKFLAATAVVTPGLVASFVTSDTSWLYWTLFSKSISKSVGGFCKIVGGFFCPRARPQQAASTIVSEMVFGFGVIMRPQCSWQTQTSRLQALKWGFKPLKRLENKKYSPPMPLVEFESEAARRELQRVLESPGFKRNERMSRFLRFLVERHLEGRGDELKESVIGIEVFAPGPVYNPKEDSIVR